MKRILTILCLCGVMLSAAGCAGAQTAGNVSNRMNGAFTAEVTMSMEDSETKAVLTRCGTDAWSVSFTEPPALSGVQLDFFDNDVTASYKGLEFSVPQSAQAVKTVLAELMEIVDEMAAETELNGTQEENSIICEGEIDEGSYSLTFSKEGIPVEFSLPCYGLTITFDSFIENGSAENSGTSADTTETAQTETTAETTDTTASE
ncbi:MAG: hypothetical protein IJ265_06750 [Oscillospiraceae bacterium]|nr:hypothetical protein [Oscillospiraceae bacterium]